MKRILFLSIFLIAIVPIISASADIAYVLKNSGSPDSAFIDAIEDTKYTYELIDDSQLNTVAWSDYSMILVGDEDFGSNAAKIPVNSMNSLLVNTENIDNWYWADSDASYSVSTRQEAKIIDNSTLITGELDGVFRVYNQNSFLSLRMYYLKKIDRASSINNLVSKDSEPDYSVIGIVEPGDRLLGGKIASAKGVFFGITKSSYWNDNSKELFKNSITWLIGDEDVDGDGYPSKLDCNDHDSDINPGANEIPYDGIDQDCNGADMTDIDGDGYDAIIAGGDDCNDNNPSVHPGAEDLSKNCVNEGPVLSRNIPDISWNEDTEKIIDLDSYFSDPDREDLIYSIESTSDNQDIVIYNLGNGVLKFNSTLNWNGNDWVIFKAEDSDGMSAVSNNVSLIVNPVNDAPIIQNPEAISGVEGSVLEIIIDAFDPEGDSMEYFLDSDLAFTKENNTFRWQANPGSKGVYTVFARVGDSNGATSSKKITITIYEKISINEFVSDPQEGNEWIEVYNPGNSAFNLGSCIFVDGIGNEINLSGSINPKEFRVFEMSNKLNNEGDAIKLYCNGNIIDSVVYGNWDDANKGTENNSPAPAKGESAGRNPDGKDTDNDKDDFKIFSISTKGMKNNADVASPIVELLFPGNESTINNTNDVSFVIKTRDDKASAMDCLLYVNNQNKKTFGAENDSEKEIIINLANGAYSWHVECSDGANNGRSENRAFSVDAALGPVINPISDKTLDEGQQIEFMISAMNEEGGNLLLSSENKPSGASFADNGNGTAKFTWKTGFSDSGSYTVKFIAENEAGMKSSINVNIKVNDVKQPVAFSDALECLLPSGMFTIEIKNPDDNDEYNIGDKINVEIKVKNNFDSKTRFDVEAYLYDLDDDQSVDDVSDSIRIDDKDSDTLELELEVPDDVEDNNHAVYVYAEADKGECTSGYVNIDVAREDDKVMVKSLRLNPKVAYPGESVDVEVEVKNIGGDDQDVVLNFDIPGLNVSYIGKEFSVEKYGDDDTKTERFSFIIPSDSTAQEYEARATIEYSGNEETKTDVLVLLKKETRPSLSGLPTPENLISLGQKYTPPAKPDEAKTTITKTPAEKREASSASSKTGSAWGLIFNVLLVMAIIVQVLIIKIAMGRKYHY